MISFELKKPEAAKPADELEVFLDFAGLDSLLAQLQFLKGGRTEHVHLMTELWGGSELTDEPQRQENTVVHHVKNLASVSGNVDSDWISSLDDASTNRRPQTSYGARAL